LSKQHSSLKKIYKIHSSRLRKNKWNLNLTLEEAKRNKELISLADSQVLRFIRQDIKKQYYINEEMIKNIKEDIARIKKLENNDKNKKLIKKLNKKLDGYLITEDYICIIIDKESDFDRCNKCEKRTKNFFLNGKQYKRLVGTTGGIKKNTIIYTSTDVYNELSNRLDNGRDKTKPLVPAKLEAYKALACSASSPVSDPKGVLVIKDGSTEFLASVIKIDDSNSEYPVMTHEKNYPIKLDFCDGCSMILPTLAKRWAKELGEDYIPTGFCIRNSFCKGMVFSFNYLAFARKVAKKHIVKDAWGNNVDIRKVELILTTNMLKLWDSYSSWNDYWDNCKKNGYTFSVTKICPEELENERTMNYQFLQSYEFSDKDIDKLIKPTIDEIHDVLGGDYIKSILFSRGIHLTDKNIFNVEFDYLKALMIEPKMIKDPFIKQKIYGMIEKRIKDAKIGVIKVRGHYTIISGDLYALCQHIFGMKVIGLLKANEFYSKTWIDKGVNQIVSYRAPMTCHNNIKKMNLVTNDEIKYWFHYMKTCLVLNAWDTTTQAMNGEDFDSDANICSDNEVLLSNTRDLDAIVCVQKSAEKKAVSEEDLIKSNKNGFGDAVGQDTNRITTMFDVISKFPKDSLEYKELDYRIKCGQHFQQCDIDKAKGIISKPMPKEWYEYLPNKIKEYDLKDVRAKKEFNIRILADKKPYFFTYIYPDIMNTYKNYIKNTNKNCLMRFGLTVNELKVKQEKTEDEIVFLKYYDLKMPVGNNPCVLNKICWRVEKEFDGFINKIKYEDFDYNILKSKHIIEVSKKTIKEITKLYKEYIQRVNEFSISAKKARIKKEDKKEQRELLKQEFKDKAYEICNNKYELCNIIVDLCYKNNNSKQFVWDIVGDVIIENLLELNNYKFRYPVSDENGNIEFGGYKFSMKEIDLLLKEDKDI
jgi:hypothetical protein